MRIPTSKLYRAFPELDNFDDDRCVRFVKAAQGNILWRAARLFALVLLGFVIFTAMCAGVSFLLSALFVDGPNSRRTYGSLPEPFALATVFLIACLSACLITLLLRDSLLRRRVRRILADNANCWKCAYRLLGLPVAKNSTITCPECGEVSQVDQALSELAIETTSTGTTQTISKQTTFVPPPVTRRPLRSRKILIRTLAACALVVLLLALSWEGFIQWQATRARALKPGIAAFASTTKATQSYSSADDAWALLVRAGQLRNRVEKDYRIELGGSWPRFEPSDHVKALVESGKLTPDVAPAWIAGGPQIHPDFPISRHPIQARHQSMPAITKRLAKPPARYTTGLPRPNSLAYSRSFLPKPSASDRSPYSLTSPSSKCSYRNLVRSAPSPSSNRVASNLPSTKAVSMKPSPFSKNSWHSRRYWAIRQVRPRSTRRFR